MSSTTLRIVQIFFAVLSWCVGLSLTLLFRRADAATLQPPLCWRGVRLRRLDLQVSRDGRGLTDWACSAKARLDPRRSAPETLDLVTVTAALNTLPSPGTGVYSDLCLPGERERDADGQWNVCLEQVSLYDKDLEREALIGRDWGDRTPGSTSCLH